jgi:outer membrane protein assembly factor BamB
MSITPEPATIRDLLEPENVERLPLFDATIINSVGKVMVFRRDTGEIIRDLPLKFAANTGCASDGSQVFIGAANGTARGVKIESGTHTWGLATEGGLLAAPRTHAGMIFVGALERFHAIRTLSVTGYEPVWSQELNNGHVAGQFHVDARGCFVPSTNNSLYAFSPYTGLPVWKRFICESPLDAPVQVGERTVFQRSSKGVLYALDVTNGSLRWSLAGARMVLGVHQGAVYVLDDHQNLRVVDEVLGTERASLPLSGLDVYVGNVTSSAVYAAHQAGTIVCLRPDAEDALASSEDR